MLATHPNRLERGTPSGIRTRDLHLERVTSWAARLWGHLREDVIAWTTLSTSQVATFALPGMIRDHFCPDIPNPEHADAPATAAAALDFEFLGHGSTISVSTTSPWRGGAVTCCPVSSLVG
jgi:hypothetical protein